MHVDLDSESPPPWLALVEVNITPKLTHFWLALFFAPAEGLSPSTGPATEPAVVLVKFFPSPPAELACAAADVFFIDVSLWEN